MTNQNQPRRNKSKEELIEEIERKKEVERQRALVKFNIFPALHDCSKTIADAKAILEYASSLIQQKGLERMYKTSTAELKMVENMKDTEAAQKYKDFFSSFDSLDIGTTITIIDQLKKGINNYVENKVDGEPLTAVEIEKIIEKSNDNI